MEISAKFWKSLARPGLALFIPPSFHPLSFYRSVSLSFPFFFLFHHLHHHQHLKRLSFAPSLPSCILGRNSRVNSFSCCAVDILFMPSRAVPKQTYRLLFWGHGPNLYLNFRRLGDCSSTPSCVLTLRSSSVTIFRVTRFLWQM